MQADEVSIHLDVYGSGDPSIFNFGGASVKYCGKIPFGNAQHQISAYDLLVLPSRHDGWGVVVNEAICAGVPVICSSNVGAQVLVDAFSVGMVFKQNDVDDLGKKLSILAKDRDKLNSMAVRCHAATQAIQPSVAAEYLLNIIEAPESARSSIPSSWYKS